MQSSLRLQETEVAHMGAKEYVQPGKFDVAGKDGAWHTAFYYLAEHVRLLTGGGVNHKELYALVGTEGRFLNHENPIVRKRTAGALSRIVHSKRYVADMRARYLQDSLAFVRAADEVCTRIRACGRAERELAAYWLDCCWPDVRRGLCNERGEWRGDIDMQKVDQEVRVLGSKSPEPRDDVLLLAAMLRLIAFGELDSLLSRALVDEYPTGLLDGDSPGAGVVADTCLVKFADAEHHSILGSWIVTEERPFTIGRYTDCDIVETGGRLSRMHACVYRKGGVWYFEDLGSRNGSEVVRPEAGVVFASDRDGARTPFALRQGDFIVLAGVSHYWFGEMGVF